VTAEVPDKTVEGVNPLAIAAGERIGALPGVPECARLALEYAIWVCEKEGREFNNGTTAAWWHLCSTLASHLKPEEN
jgi:hypothetical protein